jgi:ABC-type glycerol-3-phosphate transport system substrate-binding protein
MHGGRMIGPGPRPRADGYVNSPETIAAFQAYYDLIYTHKVSSLKHESTAKVFEQGLASMVFQHNWYYDNLVQNAPNIHFKINPMFRGKYNPVPTDTLIPTFSNLINGRENKEICFALFKAMANPEINVRLVQVSSMPPVFRDAMTMDNDYFSSQPWAKVHLDTLTKKDVPKAYDKFPGINSVAEILAEEVLGCLNGTQPREAANKAAKRMDERIAELFSK